MVRVDETARRLAQIKSKGSDERLTQEELDLLYKDVELSMWAEHGENSLSKMHSIVRKYREEVIGKRNKKKDLSRYHEIDETKLLNQLAIWEKKRFYS